MSDPIVGGVIAVVIAVAVIFIATSKKRKNDSTDN
jgi:hypothetical protein